MTDLIRAAAHATAVVQKHVDNATLGLQEFRLHGHNPLGVLLHPAHQLRDLQAARDELDQAIRMMMHTNWPTAEDYKAL